jgi:formylglycine-generating enzyme required for sulfatase activity
MKSRERSEAYRELRAFVGTCRADRGSAVIAPKQYENFDLQIEKGPGRSFRAVVLRSPTGEDEAIFRPPYEDRDLDEILANLLTIHRDLAPASVSPAKTIEQVGGRLFEALLHDKVRNRWESSRSRVEAEGKGLRLRLSLKKAPRFERWPWELLFDSSRNRFLAQSIRTPIVRYLGLPAAVPLLVAEPPLRMVVAIAAPKDYARLDGQRELERLRQALSGWEVRGWIVIEPLVGTTLEELEKSLRTPCHILHFVGHGRFDRDGKEGSLVLENESGQSNIVSGSRLGAILAAQSELRLVVLNACEGAQTSSTDPFAGLAQTLIGCRIPAVIAMRSRITDDAAITFAEHFYGSLGTNLPMDAAMADARRAMFSRRDDLEWISPVLYTRSPDCQLFHFPQERQKAIWNPWWSWGFACLVLVLAGIGLLTKEYREDPNVFWALLNPPDCPSPPGLPMAFVKIPPGTFLMGTRPVKEVTLTHPYCMGRFEVTQGQWQEIMKRSSRRKQNGDNLPVSGVSWFDAHLFLDRLNLRDLAAKFHLASEAQWEYAARAGKGTRFSFGDDLKDLPSYGNCKGQDDGYEGLAPVGSFRRNPWGLYDMYGNVSEWVEDWAAPLPAGPAVDPTGPPAGTEKVRRGGSFTYSQHCDSSYRISSKPEHRKEDIGFRIVRDPVQ